MAVKLLPKSKLEEQKAKEKFQQQEEGLKLARKVDSLRELHAQEEEKIATWRNETLEAVGKEISDLLTVKEKLISEIGRLTLEKESLIT